LASEVGQRIHHAYEQAIQAVAQNFRNASSPLYFYILREIQSIEVSLALLAASHKTKRQSQIKWYATIKELTQNATA